MFIYIIRSKKKCFFFFFSSRRRHTRLTCDWSSDVCSSDLDGLQAPGGLAQGSGRQQKAVAEAAAVNHRNLEIAQQQVVLQPIVEYQHVNVIMRGAQGRGDSQAVRADPNRATAAAGENNRLVTDLGGLVGYGGRAGRIDLRAVAARHDARRPALRFQEFGDPEHERRLAAAADREVADDDHRDAGMLRLQEPELEEEAAYENRCPEQQADRPQQPGDGAAAIPVPHYLADCVVKVSCVRPASRDASITRTTA